MRLASSPPGWSFAETPSALLAFVVGFATVAAFLTTGLGANIRWIAALPSYLFTAAAGRARMAWALCLEPSRAFAATMIGATDKSVPTSFSIGDYPSIGDHRLGAFDGAAIAADEGSKSCVWGAPYFLGKRMALVFEDLDASGEMGQPGPFFAVK